MVEAIVQRAHRSAKTGVGDLVQERRGGDFGDSSSYTDDRSRWHELHVHAAMDLYSHAMNCPRSWAIPFQAPPMMMSEAPM